MNWRKIGFDWTQMRAFLATAEEGSLTAAALVLGQTQPTVGRQVAALEADLRVALFAREGRSLRLTQAGRDLLPAAAAMREAALHASRLAEGQSQSAAGPVTITATETVATHVLPRVLAELRRTAPGIEPMVRASNAVQDLTRREADIAIRHARPEQPGLIARKLTDLRAHLYAAPTYLDRVGRPETLADLAHLDFIGFDNIDRMLPVLAEFGLPIRRETIRSASTSGPVIAQMAREGMGVTILTGDMAQRAGGLEQMLPGTFSIPVPVWLVSHEELRSAPRFRITFDLIADHLSRPASFA